MKSESTGVPYTAVARCRELEQLASKEYLDVLKNVLEVPKYLVSLLVFLATASAAISRIGPASTNAPSQDEVVQTFGDLEKAFFLAAMLLTLWVFVLGYRVVAKTFDEMILSSDAHKAQRGERFNSFRCGPYTDFVKWCLLAIVLWTVSLICIVW